MAFSRAIIPIVMLSGFVVLALFPQATLACSKCLGAGKNEWAYIVSYIILTLLPFFMLSVFGHWVYRQYSRSGNLPVDNESH